MAEISNIPNKYALCIWAKKRERAFRSKVTGISLDEAREAFADSVESAVGHADTAAVLGEQLGVAVPVNRTTVSLLKGDVAIIGQYRGPRLPEGCTALPDGASIAWLRVTI